MLIEKGIEMMWLGMGTVFVFLFVLLILIKLMSKIVRSIEIPREANQVVSPAIQVDDKTFKVLQQAMKQHYSKI